MYIVFSIVGNVVVDDHQDVVDIYTASHDVSSYQYVDLSSLELVHHLVALSLREVAVHGGTVDIHVLQLARYVFHLVFLAGEDNYALQLASLEQVADNAQLLWLIADVGRLLDFLSGFGNGYLYLCGMIEQGACQLLNLVWHGG